MASFCYNTPIATDSHEHRAHLDDDGNIVLPDVAYTQAESMDIPPLEVEQTPEPVAEIPEPQPTRTEPSISARSRHIWQGVRSAVYETTQNVVLEGRSQLQASAAEFSGVKTEWNSAKQKLGTRLKAFMFQPVWIVKPNQKPKKRNRFTLFTLDAVRFGGTFATIFVLLFVGLNYESFWQIAKEKIDPLQNAQEAQARTASLDSALRQKLQHSPTLATAGTDDSLLSMVPTVGPPDNRLIIPKLNLNVPLVQPSVASLLAEDWTKVEEDIQEGLAEGVVHYPGTARPGQAGNFFVTGHSSYYPWAPGQYKTVFARLHLLEPGDEYYVYYGGDEYRYVVQSKTEVKPSNVDVLDQPTDKRISTLMTCTPVGTTLRRLILVAQEVDPVTGAPMDIGERHHDEPLNILPDSLPI